MVMFFGLTNSPATFQAMMNELFTHLIQEGKVIIYLDDILIFTSTIQEHRQLVKQVLRILQENHLYLKPEKCDFKQTKIDYLGMVVEQGRMSMDPAKVEGLTDWPTPESTKQVRSFLGFGNFY